MNPVFLDTSYVIALRNSSDAHHEKAKELAGQFQSSKRQLVTTLAVLVELGDGFARKGRWQEIAPFLNAALSDPALDVVPLDGALLAKALDLRKARPDKDWGLTDCVSFVVMTERGLEEAASADRHFLQAGFRALLLEP
jgi:predicted nucleic acid-binding protein